MDSEDPSPQHSELIIGKYEELTTETSVVQSNQEQVSAVLEVEDTSTAFFLLPEGDHHPEGQVLLLVQPEGQEIVLLDEHNNPIPIDPNSIIHNEGVVLANALNSDAVLSDGVAHVQLVAEAAPDNTEESGNPNIQTYFINTVNSNNASPTCDSTTKEDTESIFTSHFSTSLLAQSGVETTNVTDTKEKSDVSFLPAENSPVVGDTLTSNSPSSFKTLQEIKHKKLKPLLELMNLVDNVHSPNKEDNLAVETDANVKESQAVELLPCDKNLSMDSSSDISSPQAIVNESNSIKTLNPCSSKRSINNAVSVIQSLSSREHSQKQADNADELENISPLTIKNEEETNITSIKSEADDLSQIPYNSDEPMEYIPPDGTVIKNDQSIYEDRITENDSITVPSDLTGNETIPSIPVDAGNANEACSSEETIPCINSNMVFNKHDRKLSDTSLIANQKSIENNDDFLQSQRNEACPVTTDLEDPSTHNAILNICNTDARQNMLSSMNKSNLTDLAADNSAKDVTNVNAEFEHDKPINVSFADKPLSVIDCDCPESEASYQKLFQDQISQPPRKRKFASVVFHSENASRSKFYPSGEEFVMTAISGSASTKPCYKNPQLIRKRKVPVGDVQEETKCASFVQTDKDVKLDSISSIMTKHKHIKISDHICAHEHSPENNEMNVDFAEKNSTSSLDVEHESKDTSIAMESSTDENSLHDDKDFTNSSLPVSDDSLSGKVPESVLENVNPEVYEENSLDASSELVIDEQIGPEECHLKSTEASEPILCPSELGSKTSELENFMHPIFPNVSSRLEVNLHNDKGIIHELSHPNSPDISPALGTNHHIYDDEMHEIPDTVFPDAPLASKENHPSNENDGTHEISHPISPDDSSALATNQHCDALSSSRENHSNIDVIHEHQPVSPDISSPVQTSHQSDEDNGIHEISQPIFPYASSSLEINHNNEDDEMHETPQPIFSDASPTLETNFHQSEDDCIHEISGPVFPDASVLNENHCTNKGEELSQLVYPDASSLLETDHQSNEDDHMHEISQSVSPDASSELDTNVHQDDNDMRNAPCQPIFLDASSELNANHQNEDDEMHKGSCQPIFPDTSSELEANHQNEDDDMHKVSSQPIFSDASSELETDLQQNDGMHAISCQPIFPDASSELEPNHQNENDDDMHNVSCQPIFPDAPSELETNHENNVSSQPIFPDTPTELEADHQNENDDDDVHEISHHPVFPDALSETRRHTDEDDVMHKISQPIFPDTPSELNTNVDGGKDELENFTNKACHSESIDTSSEHEVYFYDHNEDKVENANPEIHESKLDEHSSASMLSLHDDSLHGITCSKTSEQYQNDNNIIHSIENDQLTSIDPLESLEHVHDNCEAMNEESESIVAMQVPDTFGNKDDELEAHQSKSGVTIQIKNNDQIEIQSLKAASDDEFESKSAAMTSDIINTCSNSEDIQTNELKSVATTSEVILHLHDKGEQEDLNSSHDSVKEYGKMMQKQSAPESSDLNNEDEEIKNKPVSTFAAESCEEQENVNAEVSNKIINEKDMIKSQSITSEVLRINEDSKASNVNKAESEMPRLLAFRLVNTDNKDSSKIVDREVIAQSINSEVKDDHKHRASWSQKNANECDTVMEEEINVIDEGNSVGEMPVLVPRMESCKKIEMNTELTCINEENTSQPTIAEIPENFEIVEDNRDVMLKDDSEQMERDEIDISLKKHNDNGKELIISPSCVGISNEEQTTKDVAVVDSLAEHDSSLQDNPVSEQSPPTADNTIGEQNSHCLNEAGSSLPQIMEHLTENDDSDTSNAEESRVKRPLRTYAGRSKKKATAMEDNSYMDQIKLFSCEELDSHLRNEVPSSPKEVTHSEPLAHNDDDDELVYNIKSKVSAVYKSKKKVETAKSSNISGPSSPIETTSDNPFDDDDFIYNIKSKVSAVFTRKKKKPINEEPITETNEKKIPENASDEDLEFAFRESSSSEEPPLIMKRVRRKKRSHANMSNGDLDASHRESLANSPLSRPGCSSWDLPSAPRRHQSLKEKWERFVKSSPSKSKRSRFIFKRKLAHKFKKRLKNASKVLHKTEALAKKRRAKIKRRKRSDLEWRYINALHNSSHRTSKSTMRYVCLSCGFWCKRVNNFILHDRMCGIEDSTFGVFEVNYLDRIQNEDLDNFGTNCSSYARELQRRFSDESDAESINPPDSSDDDDDNEIRVTFHEKYGFYEDDVVWLRMKTMFWPALVYHVNPKEKRASVMLINAPLEKRAIKVPIKKLRSFNDAQLNKRILEEGKDYNDPQNFLKTAQKAERFVCKRWFGTNISGAEYFGEPIDANFETDHELCSSPDLSDSEDDCNHVRREDDSERFLTVEHDVDIELPLYQEKEIAVSNEIDQDKIFSCIVEGYINDYLLSVYNKEIESERHHKFFSSNLLDKESVKAAAHFGPLQNRSMRSHLYDYFENMFESLIGKLPFSVAYIHEVWIPEAIIKAISLVQDMSIEDARCVFEDDENVQHSEEMHVDEIDDMY